MLNKVIPKLPQRIQMSACSHAFSPCLPSKLSTKPGCEWSKLAGSVPKRKQSNASGPLISGGEVMGAPFQVSEGRGGHSAAQDYVGITDGNMPGKDIPKTA